MIALALGTAPASGCYIQTYPPARVTAPTASAAQGGQAEVGTAPVAAPADECVDWAPSGECTGWASDAQAQPEVQAQPQPCLQRNSRGECIADEESEMLPTDECIDWDPSGECIGWPENAYPTAE